MKSVEELRKKWLPSREGFEKQLNLYERFKTIRDRVTHLHYTKEGIPQMKFYTPHGVEHYEEVEKKLLYDLLPQDTYKKLSENERFFLLSSAWIHDIGMIKGILYGDESRDDEEIRNKHHKRSEKYIAKDYRTIAIEEFEATSFGMLARFHRRRCPLTDCPERVHISEHGILRLRLLAAYLRLADALHVDQSRAPDDQYAIMLAYDIPNKSKLHWLKSKFILGIDVNIDSKSIVVHLKRPMGEEKDKYVRRSLEKIYNNIVQDLNDELETVKDTLFRANITYFLEINKEIHNVQFDDQLFKDIMSIIHSYSIIDNPSSSALCKLVLQSIKGIIESYSPNIQKEIKSINDIIKLNIDEEIKKYNIEDTTIREKVVNFVKNGINGMKNSFFKEESNNVDSVTIERIKSFIKEVDDNVLKSRKCHTALQDLIEEIKKKINSKEPKIKDIYCFINDKFISLGLNRKRIRHNAFRYFYSKKDGYFGKYTQKEYKNNKCNVLFYGYSELAIKTICGFRDAVISNLVDEYSSRRKDVITKDYSEDIAKPIHKEELEKKASEYFRIFVCEGQPKNKTAWGGRIIYNDGLSYSLSLQEKGFTEIHPIPDAIAASLISGEDSCLTIDFIIVGANGVEKTLFRHSAGHLMIAASKKFRENEIAINIENKDKILCPQLILAFISDKYKEYDNCNEYCSTVSQESQEDKIIDVGGWNFHQKFDDESVRKNIFISQDNEWRKTLKDKPSISFYNPREDKIKIDYVDVVITENGWMEKYKNEESINCIEFQGKKTDEVWNGEKIAQAGDSKPASVSNKP